MPGRGLQFWPFSVQIVPDQTSRYVPGNTRFIGFRKVLYRTLVIPYDLLKTFLARVHLDVDVACCSTLILPFVKDADLCRAEWSGVTFAVSLVVDLCRNQWFCAVLRPAEPLFEIDHTALVPRWLQHQLGGNTNGRVWHL